MSVPDEVAGCECHRPEPGCTVLTVTGELDACTTPGLEEQVLGHLAGGASNREISRALFLSEKTVKAHLAAVFRKLGVSNRTQAAMAAVAMGLGPPGFMAGRPPVAAADRAHA